MHLRSSAYHQRPDYPEAEKAAYFGNCRADYSCCRLKAQFSRQVPRFTRGKVERGRNLVLMSLPSLYETLCAPTWKTTRVPYTGKRCWLKRSPTLVHRPLPSLRSPRGGYTARCDMSRDCSSTLERHSTRHKML